MQLDITWIKSIVGSAWKNVLQAPIPIHSPLNANNALFLALNALILATALNVSLDISYMQIIATLPVLLAFMLMVRVPARSVYKLVKYALMLIFALNA